MLLFRMQPTNQQPSDEQLAIMKQQWSVFIGGIAAQAKLVSTSRLGFDGAVIYKTLSTNNVFNMANNEMLSGNMVVKTASLQEATELAKDCPILMMGGSVEVRNIIPMEA